MPIAIHGAISGTAAYSDEYNYIGKTGDSINVNTVEVFLNGNYQFPGGLRFGAQAYAYRLGDYDRLTLDFASFDYSINEAFGVRLGRNKQAWGLYGEAQDVDMVRPFAFLPLDYYPRLARATDASFDGMSLYGTINLARAGRLEYQAFGGWMVRFDPSDPYFQVTNEGLPAKNEEQKGHQLFGGWLAWHTPVTGLKVGTSYVEYTDVASKGPAKTSAELAQAPSDVRLLPLSLPAGMWDALIAGKPSSISTVVSIATLFAEYTRGDWVFAAEIMNYDYDTDLTLPLLGTTSSPRRSQAWYAMATYQISPKVQVGAYYGRSYEDRHDRSGSKYVITPRHRAGQKDLAGSVAYQMTDWWMVKAEAHLLDGTKIVDAANNGDMLKWKPHWTYFVVKSTISF